MSEAIALVPTKPDAEVAADLKHRLAEAMAPALKIFDEAAVAGFIVQWESIAPQAPFYRHGINGLRLVKHF